jgi:hypothetical protein
MKTLIFSIIFIVNGSFSTVKDHSASYLEVNHSKVKVIVTENNVPLSGVLVKITQGNMHLGETITDEYGKAIILCKYLSKDNKEVEIIASKQGYQPVNIHGNLITSLTDFQFNITKEGEISTQSNNLNFQIQYETLKADF